LAAIIVYACWYFPIGLYQNAIDAGQGWERAWLMFLLVWAFLMFTSTFAHAVVVGVDTAEAGGNITNFIFSMSLIFCGVLASPTALPGFWIFMYRVSPFTYLVSAMLSVGVANTHAVCSAVEVLAVQPFPAGTACGTYMAPYIQLAGGYVTNPSATSDCGFCSISDTNVFLAAVSSHYEDRWMNFGIFWVYVVVNIVGAVLIYWLARVPKGSKRKDRKDKKSGKHE